jgi:hypothetical protein
MGMNTIAIALLIAISTSAHAAAPEPRIVTHNGSVMTLQVLGDDIEIRYLVPRPGLGVAPNTLLLSGRWNGPVLNATAVVFAGPCGAFPYAVTGGIDGFGNLVLEGPSPVIDLIFCQQIGLNWNGNSYLMFTRTAAADEPAK